MDNRMNALKTLGVALLLACCMVVPADAREHKRVLPVGQHYVKVVERWRPLVRHYWHTARQQQEALAVIWCESGGNPRCRYHTSREDSRGLFQHNCIWLHDKTLYWRVYRPKTAIRLGYKQWAAQGRRWSPAWTTARMLHLR